MVGTVEKETMSADEQADDSTISTPHACELVNSNGFG